MALLNLALTGLETLINGYLRLDPETLARLEKISGKVIKIEISDWSVTLFLCPEADGLRLFAEYPGEPDAVIRGKLLHLFRVGSKGGETSQLFENQVEVEGDIELGQNIRDILAQIDIDWEEHLSRIVGDVLAHKMSIGIKRTVNAGKQMGEVLKRNISEYLFEEAKAFPTRQAVDEFYAQVATLRDDVERAEMRINRVWKTLSGQDKEQE